LGVIGKRRHLLGAALFALGCSSPLTGSTNIDASASCSPTSPPPAPSPTDGGATSEAIIEAEWLTLLDQEFGQYLRGDILVYRGTLNGSASLPAALGYVPGSDAAIAQGDALASLAFFPGSPYDWISTVPPPFVDSNVAILIVHSLAQDQSMVFGQPESDPSVTATGGIVNGATTNRLWATCSQCGPNLWARSETIALDLTAAGTITTDTYYGSTTSEAVTTTARAHLGLVAPCNLTFGDLKTLNELAGPSNYTSVGLSVFTLSGGEWVWHAGSTIATNAPPPDGACSGGVSYANYTVDLYVNAANLADYGVRNFTLGSTFVACPI
jgi:hypothetical protein